jgi:hypothetical protein
MQAFATDDGEASTVFRLFRAQQRAIGELMIAPADASGRVTCLGYADFTVRRRKAPMQSWLAPLEADLAQIADMPYDCPRLVHLQRALVDLVDLLDPERVRYPDTDVRGRLPLSVNAATREERHVDRVARFVFREREGEPWLVFSTWAGEHGFATSTDTEIWRADWRIPVRRRVVVELRRDGAWVEVVARISGGWRRRPPTRMIEGRGRLSSLRARSARVAVNDLLRRLDRPEI